MARALSIRMFRGLALLGFLFAPFSFLMLDAPWASGGIGAGLIWLMIFGFWGLAGASLLASRAVQEWRWSLTRAALFPTAAALVLLLAEILIHIVLRQCVLICI
jgi:hypothetical protein